MRFWEYILIRLASDQLTREAAKQGKKETDTNRVEQIPGFRWFFCIVALIGAVLGTCVLYFGKSVFGAVILYGLFGLLSIPILISYHTCYIDFDEQGFLVSNFFGMKKRYLYEQVTGLGQTTDRVEIEVLGKKRIKLNETWVNRNRFADKIKAHNKNVKKLQTGVLGLSVDGIRHSYENGILRQAMLVSKKKEVQEEFSHWKKVHRRMILIGIVNLVLLFFAGSAAKPGTPIGILYFLTMVLLNGMFLLAIFLYFKKPQFFTAREKPADQLLEKDDEKNHKLCTLAYMAVFSMLGNLLFFAASERGRVRAVSTLTFVLPLILVLLLLLIYIGVFKRHSDEYITYRIGYVSYVFAIVMHLIGIYVVLFALF